MARRLAQLAELDVTVLKGVGDKHAASLQAARELVNIEQRRCDYAGARQAIDFSGRTVIVVDDGVATGMTMQAALRSVRRRRPAGLIAAAPVASRQAVARLRRDRAQEVGVGVQHGRPR